MELIEKSKHLHSFQLAKLYVPKETLYNYITKYSWKEISYINLYLILPFVDFLIFNLLELLLAYLRKQAYFWFQELMIKDITDDLLLHFVGTSFTEQKAISD